MLGRGGKVGKLWRRGGGVWRKKKEKSGSAYVYSIVVVVVVAVVRVAVVRVAVVAVKREEGREQKSNILNPERKKRKERIKTVRNYWDLDQEGLADYIGLWPPQMSFPSCMSFSFFFFFFNFFVPSGICWLYPSRSKKDVWYDRKHHPDSAREGLLTGERERESERQIAWVDFFFFLIPHTRVSRWWSSIESLITINFEKKKKKKRDRKDYNPYYSSNRRLLVVRQIKSETRVFFLYYYYCHPKLTPPLFQ